MKGTPKLKSKSWAESLLYQLGHAVIAVDSDSRITYLNEAAERMLGLPGSAVVGTSLEELIRLTNATSGKLVRLPLERIAEQNEYYIPDENLILEIPEQGTRPVTVVANSIESGPQGQKRVAIQICEKEASTTEATRSTTEDDVIPDFFFVKKDGSFIKVMAESLQWIEAMENYAVLVTGDERYVVHTTLKKLASRLADLGFVRVHRSYIVPLAKIDAIEDNRLHIGNHEVPIGKSYRSQLMEQLHFI